MIVAILRDNLCDIEAENPSIWKDFNNVNPATIKGLLKFKTNL